jgi:hypothetical protein
MFEEIVQANEKFAEHYIQIEGIIPNLRAEGMPLDALRRLAIERFKEDYTEKAIDELFAKAWIRPQDKELFFSVVAVLLLLLC